MHNANTILLSLGEIKNPLWIMLSNRQRINTSALPMQIVHVQYFVFDTLTKVWLCVLIKMNWRVHGMCFFIQSLTSQVTSFIQKRRWCVCAYD